MKKPKKLNLPLISDSSIPSLKILRQLDLNPAMKAVHTLQSSGVFAEIARVQTQHEQLLKALNSSKWVQLQADMAQFQGLSLKPETLAAFAGVNTDIARMASHLQRAVLPEIIQVQEISAALASTLSPIRSDMTAWSASLSAQMNTLKQPWALEGAVGISITGFARIGILSDIAKSEAPFGAISGEIFKEELFQPYDEGEAEYENRDDNAVEAGLNPELIAMYPSEYGHVLSSAGFNFAFSMVRVPQAEGTANAGEAYNPAHDALLKQVEILLRQLIEDRLRAVSGENWEKHRISGDKRKKWIGIREQEAKNTGRKFPLIQYAEFMDLVDIICQKNNWSEEFSIVFGNKDDFRVSMTRLHPIRKALAHARPLARSDVLLLVCEASRLLTVLRRVYPLT